MNHAHGNEPCSSGKVAYKTRTAAQRHMQARKQKMSCYKCPECGAIHLTTAERSSLKRIKKTVEVNSLTGVRNTGRSERKHRYNSKFKPSDIPIPPPVKAVTNLGELLTQNL